MPRVVSAGITKRNQLPASKTPNHNCSPPNTVALGFRVLIHQGHRCFIWCSQRYWMFQTEHTNTVPFSSQFLHRCIQNFCISSKFLHLSQCFKVLLFKIYASLSIKKANATTSCHWWLKRFEVAVPHSFLSFFQGNHEVHEGYEIDGKDTRWGQHSSKLGSASQKTCRSRCRLRCNSWGIAS